MTTNDMGRELDTACELAAAAGAIVAEAFGQRKEVRLKSPVDLVTQTDREAQELILSGIAKAFPDHAIVAEEGAPSPRVAGPCWYVDPIDGTTNFVHDLPHCSVSIAFFDDGEPRAAAVYDPCKDEMFAAEKGAGATMNRSPIRVSSSLRLGESLLVTGFPYDRRDRVEFYLAYFKAFLLSARDLRRFGSAALDLCYVAASRFDGFWEWGLHPWDTAAGWLIVEEAGGRVSDFDGAPFDPWLPRVLATNGRIHEEILALLATLPADPESVSVRRGPFV